MRQVALFAAAAAASGAVASAAADDDAAFTAFKRRYSISYDSAEEEAARRGAFSASIRRIAAANADAADYATYGVTRRADSTDAERRYRCGGTTRRGVRITARRGVTATNHTWDGTCYAGGRLPQNCDNTTQLPDAFDWTDHGAVTSVRDQGRCGNCWAFGGVGDAEGAWYLAGHDLVALSEQQLTSCDTVGRDGGRDGNDGGDDGCDGGSTNLDTDEYAVTVGLTSLANYPYCSGKYKCAGIKPRDKRNGICNKTKEAQAVARFTGGYQVSGGNKKDHCDWCNHRPYDEELLREHVFRAGPTTIGINSGDSSPFDDYKKGIMNPKGCKSNFASLDHQVLIVGYGSENGIDYWRIKNSYGEGWGEKGFIRVARGANVCGVATDATHIIADAARGA